MSENTDKVMPLTPAENLPPSPPSYPVPLKLESLDEARNALDALHVEEIDRAFEELERLESEAMSDPWSVVEHSDDFHEICSASGDLVGDSFEAADAAFLIALRNRAKALIRQCKNHVAIVADLDGVHEALGIDYNHSATEAVLKLKQDYVTLATECMRLQDEVHSLKARVETR